jgi:DNA repair exonuclease SbcCD ATPase subunit
MITFEKIRWRNFLSTGNQFTEINFTQTSSTLVIGSNGAGKSTMLDALCFGLFNKPFRKITKSQLVNTINERDTLVEIEFQVGTIDYKVVRGIKPGVFEIYRNDSLIDQDAANRDYQKYLEQSILKLNFKSFTQVVILGSSTFVPFMQLGASHRREVIEDLLDIQIFSYMNMLLKERVKDNNEILRDCKHELEMATAAIKAQEKTLSKLTIVNDERIAHQKERFDNNEERMKTLKEEIEEFQKKINKLVNSTTKLKTKEDEYKKTFGILSKLNGRQERVAKDIKFFKDNSSCPVCTQEIEEKFRKVKVKTLNEKVDELNEAAGTLEKQVHKTLQTIEKLREDSSNVTEYQFEIRRLVNEEQKLMKQNTDILSQIKNLTDESDLGKEQLLLTKLQEEFNEKETACSGVSKEAQDYKLVGNLLKDGGIKAKIISKYIPIINQRINRYLTSMDTYINFTLNEEFGEVIKSRHRDKFSYSSFSEGEKQKIDLALLFTWRHVAKLKNSIITNLLILDEVFDSSLDNTATEELLKILKELYTDTNMFIISHKGDVLLDKFDRTIRFEKVNEFSKVFEDV